MACTTFIKDTAGWRGTLSLLLLGLLLHSVIVSGQNNMTSTTMMPNTTTTATQSTEPSTATTTSTASAPTSTSTTIPTTSASTAAPTTQSAASTASGATTYTGTTQSLTSGGSASATTAATSTGSTMTTSGGQATATSVTTQPPTTTATSGGIASTTTNQSLTIMTTSGGAATSIPTQSPTATSGGIASTTTNQSLTNMTTSGGAATSIPTQSPSATSGAMTQYTSAMPTNCSVVTMMSNSLSSNYTDKPVMNGTMMISCPAFTCNHSTCYTMYTSQNATPCGAGVCFCQLTRQMDMWYTANCTTSCAAPCANTSDTNCSVVCCYSPDCLNRSFTSMMMTTTVAPTTTTTATTTTTPQTTNNANQCHTGTCIGINCYTEFADAEKCSSSQPHCQLKQETVAGGLQWTAGCSTNCSTQTPCKTSTQPPCHLECCNATKTSCLWRNGTLHVPNFAPGGPRHQTELIAILLCLLAIAWVNE